MSQQSWGRCDARHRPDAEGGASPWLDLSGLAPAKLGTAIFVLIRTYGAILLLSLPRPVVRKLLAKDGLARVLTDPRRPSSWALIGRRRRWPRRKRESDSGPRLAAASRP